MKDVRKILEDPITLENVAEKIGRVIKDKERQIRLIYETILRSPDLVMVKPRLKYQVARMISRERNDYIKSRIIEFSNILDRLIDEVRKKGVNSEEFENAKERLLNFVEAVISYARYYRVQEE
ncbi:MAG TPA: type III-A CRISPR-associated protein Csm2 [Archaeoglobus profundus]|nr:type III-A CRISPR-associated protein Csm2 [Archaeoglobus profundus]